MWNHGFDAFFWSLFVWLAAPTHHWQLRHSSWIPSSWSLPPWIWKPFTSLGQNRSSQKRSPRPATTRPQLICQGWNLVLDATSVPWRSWCSSHLQRRRTKKKKGNPKNIIKNIQTLESVGKLEYIKIPTFLQCTKEKEPKKHTKTPVQLRFVLTPGMDPTGQLRALAISRNVNWQTISLGQGQEPSLGWEASEVRLRPIAREELLGAGWEVEGFFVVLCLVG